MLLLSIFISFPFALVVSYFLFNMIRLVSRKTARRLSQPQRQRWTLLYMIAFAHVIQVITATICTTAMHAALMSAVPYSSVAWATYPLIFALPDPGGLSLCILTAIVLSAIFQCMAHVRLK